MKHSRSGPAGGPDIEGIIEILTRIYEEIRAIEADMGLLFGGGDFRPRIDYFHDAVRALMSGNDARLSVELLAYDARALAYVQAHPLLPVKQSGQSLSSATALATRKENALAPSGNRRAGREAKQHLSELYQQYGVLFTALFKPYADNDYRDRKDELDETVTQLNAALQAIRAGGKGAEAMIAQLDDPKLRTELLRLLVQKRQGEAAALLAEAAKRADRDIKEIEDAHLYYATAQLNLYETGRDMVKQLAAHGMNLAGRFVENAMQQARRDMGRQR